MIRRDHFTRHSELYDGSRVYDGCPDSTMQRRLDMEAREEEELLKDIHEIDSEIHVTYFPGVPDQGWILFKKYKVFEDKSHSTKLGALRQALCLVKQGSD